MESNLVSGEDEEDESSADDETVCDDILNEKTFKS